MVLKQVFLFALLLVAILATMASAKKIHQQMMLDDELVDVSPKYPALYQFLDYRSKEQSWRQINSVNNTALKANFYYLEFISGKWLTEADSNINIWSHHATVIVPWNAYRNDMASLYITSCNNGDLACEASQTSTFQLYAAYSSMITILLFNNNPGPVAFSHLNDTTAWRTEDNVVGPSYVKLLQDPTRPDWSVTLPMARAAKVILDVVEEWSAEKVAAGEFVAPIRWFNAFGVSKRGLSTYNLAAYEGSKKTKQTPCRLLAAAAISYDALHFREVVVHQTAVLGGFTLAFTPFKNAGFLTYLDNPKAPEWKELMNIIDPISKHYQNGMDNVPHYIALGSADEFFLPTDFYFYWPEIKHTATHAILPDTNHGMQSKSYPALLNVLLSVAAHAKAASHMIPEIEAQIAAPCKGHNCEGRKVIKSYPDLQPDLPQYDFDHIFVKAKPKKNVSAADIMVYEAFDEKPATLSLYYATNERHGDWRNTTIKWTAVPIDVANPAETIVKKHGKSVTYKYKLDMQSVVDTIPEGSYFAMFYHATYFIDGTQLVVSTPFIQYPEEPYYQSCDVTKTCSQTQLLPYV